MPFHLYSATMAFGITCLVFLLVPAPPAPLVSQHLSFFFSPQRTCNFCSSLFVSLFFSSRVIFKGCRGRLGRTKTTCVCATLLHPQEQKKHIVLVCSQRVESGREHSLGDMQGPSSEGSSSGQGLKPLVNPPQHPNKCRVLQHPFTAQCLGWCQPGK